MALAESVSSMRNGIPASNPTRNHLFHVLPQAERERLLPDLRPVAFSLGQVVCEPDQLIDYCYFPTNSVVSLLYTAEDGATAEMGLVGNEGVMGIPAFLGGESTCSKALVAVSGDAFRMPARLLQEEFAHPGALQHLLLL